MKKIPSSEITPESVYLSRRRLMGSLTGVVGSALLPQGLWAADNYNYEELRKELTPLKAIAGYNNFYEFSSKKEEVAPLSQGFRTSPWSVKVGGHVSKPT